ncbi:MAG TPA: hypothetical protein VLF42_09585 [Burkholderiales bacterium]|nr:hypothetical protein [Burkholderiales bacterium]
MRASAPALALLFPALAQAHGFGTRYELPLPLAIYLTSAALTILLSFLAMAWFSRRAVSAGEGWSFDMLTTLPGRLLASAPVLFVLRLAAVALFVLVVAAGLLGTQSPLKNIAPAFVWALWWVGMTYLSALAGDLWALLNPLETIFRWAEAAHARARPGRRLSLDLPYPQAAGVWPAAALFLVFVWMELVWEGADRPASVSLAIIAYAALAWTGMLLFGRREWLRRGEVFAIVFGLIARFSPTQAREVDGRWQWKLRPYAVGLLAREPAGASEVALIAFMLAAVTFDGLRETPLWAAASLGDVAGLLGTALLMLAAYLLVCKAMVPLGENLQTWRRTAGLFIFTLIPIAIAYHLAHYLSFLGAALQYMIPLASDPFGRGWDLFGGATHFVRPGIVDAKTVWYVAVPAIVAGHMLAVWLAHLLALREFPGRRAALRSQYPMVALMIAYTMTSLWIIAQPIVTER